MLRNCAREVLFSTLAPGTDEQLNTIRHQSVNKMKFILTLIHYKELNIHINTQVLTKFYGESKVLRQIKDNRYTTIFRNCRCELNFVLEALADQCNQC